MRNIFLATFALHFLTFGAMAEEGSEPVITKRTALSFRLDVPEPDSVAQASLYVTEDGGATWKSGESVGHKAGEPLPKLHFTADHDGSYGFNTRVTYADQHADPEPQAGQAPDYEVIVDTTAPTIASFEVWLLAMRGSQAEAHIAWRVDDAHLDEQGVVLEASADGANFTVVQRSGRLEDRTATIPLSPNQSRILLILTANDLAGNQTISPIQTIDLAAPVAANADAMDQALSALPELAPASAKATAGEPAARQEEPRPEPAKPAPPVIAAAPAKPETKSDSGNLEGEYQGKLAQASESRSGALWKNAAPAKRMELEGAPEKKAKVAPAPETEPAPDIYLTGIRSQALLGQARAAANADDQDRAAILYQRLRKSDLAAQALPEELRLMAGSGRTTEALNLIEQLPPESYSNTVRLEHGKMLLGLGRDEEAVATLVKIARGSPCAPDALYGIARAYIGMQKTAEAKRILQYLSQGQGEVAAAATRDLADLP